MVLPTCRLQLGTASSPCPVWFSHFVAVSPKRAVFFSFLVFLVYRRIMTPSLENAHHNASVLRDFLHLLMPSLPSETHTSVSHLCSSRHCLLVSLLNAEPLLGLSFPGSSRASSSPFSKPLLTMQTWRNNDNKMASSSQDFKKSNGCKVALTHKGWKYVYLVDIAMLCIKSFFECVGRSWTWSSLRDTLLSL